MLSPRPLVVGACLAAVLLSGCGQRGPDAAVGATTLATVGGATVDTGEVRALLSPTGGGMPVRLAAGAGDGSADGDPLELALRAAITDELLALEADRREIDGVNRAQQLSRLLDEEVRPRIPDAGEAELREWYAGHRHLFDAVESADVHFVVLDSPAAIEEVVASLRASSEVPGVVVDGSPAVDSGRAVMSHDGDEVPIMIERMVHAARYEGAITYDRDPATGRWWVAEVVDLELEPSPWSAELATKVAEAMRWAAEQELVAVLAASLAEEWPVVRHQENIERFDRGLRGE